jgi:hypothetical protein
MDSSSTIVSWAFDFGRCAGESDVTDIWISLSWAFLLLTKDLILKFDFKIDSPSAQLS